MLLLLKDNVYHWLLLLLQDNVYDWICYYYYMITYMTGYDNITSHIRYPVIIITTSHKRYPVMIIT
jgi:hypothetical protein